MKANLQAGRATVQRTQLNAWGVMQVLHTLRVLPLQTRATGEFWTLTTLWALSMDAVAGGLIVMVLGGYIMWFRLRAKRVWRYRRPVAGLRQLWSIHRGTAVAALRANDAQSQRHPVHV